jgi:hypothetical protein
MTKLLPLIRHMPSTDITVDRPDITGTLHARASLIEFGPTINDDLSAQVNQVYSRDVVILIEARWSFSGIPRHCLLKHSHRLDRL